MLASVYFMNGHRSPAIVRRSLQMKISKIEISKLQLCLVAILTITAAIGAISLYRGSCTFLCPGAETWRNYKDKFGKIHQFTDKVAGGQIVYYQNPGTHTADSDAIGVSAFQSKDLFYVDGMFYIYTGDGNLKNYGSLSCVSEKGPRVRAVGDVIVIACKDKNSKFHSVSTWSKERGLISYRRGDFQIQLNGKFGIARMCKAKMGI